MRISKVTVVFSIAGILLIVGWLLLPDIAALLGSPGKPGLPRIQFADGGEFRVVQVRYTRKPSEASDHAIGNVPRVSSWLWRHMPKSLQSRIDFPSSGISYYGSPRPALSIWWTYIHPKTANPELGPTDWVTTTLDSGEQLKPIWPSPYDPYRQIFLNDPPTNSKNLHFRFSVEDSHPVEFTIKNPAYRR